MKPSEANKNLAGVRRDKVSLFYNVSESNSADELITINGVANAIINGKHSISIRKAREALERGEKSEYEQVKRSLPLFTPSLRLRRGVSRSLGSITSSDYTGFIVMDMDSKGKYGENNPDMLAKVKRTMRKSPSTIMAFNSPSGAMGLKLVIKVDTLLEDHYDAFMILKERMEEAFEGLVIDPSGCDPTRLCYLSYDKEAHFNPHATAADINLGELARRKHRRMVANKSKAAQRNPGGPAPWLNVLPVIKKTIETINKKIGPFEDGNRHNHLKALCMSFVKMSFDKEVSVFLQESLYPFDDYVEEEGKNYNPPTPGEFFQKYEHKYGEKEELGRKWAGSNGVFDKEVNEFFQGFSNPQAAYLIGKCIAPAVTKGLKTVAILTCASMCKDLGIHHPTEGVAIIRKLFSDGKMAKRLLFS